MIQSEIVRQLTVTLLETVWRSYYWKLSGNIAGNCQVKLLSEILSVYYWKPSGEVTIGNYQEILLETVR